MTPTALSLEERAALNAAALDEAILRRRPRSLAAFVKRAWAVVEPGTPLVWNWHIDLICSKLERVPHEIKDLVLCIPPGMMKSLLVSVFFPAWLWLDRPQERILSFSKTRRVATRDSRKMRKIIKSEWYRSLIQQMHDRYGKPLWGMSKDEDQKISFENDYAGSRVSLSLGADIIGDRCDGQIVDDPLDVADVLGEPKKVAERINNVNEVIEIKLPTRTVPGGWRVIVMQRLHPNDPAARAIADGAVHVVLPMRKGQEPPELTNAADNREPDELLFPKVYDEEFDAHIRRRLGQTQYGGQYGQNPRAKSGGLYKEARFDQTYNFDAQRHQFDAVGLSVDCTFKDDKRGKKVDWVVFGAWGRRGERRYLLDIVRAKMNYPTTRKRFKLFCQKWPHARFALIEDKANGSALIDDLDSAYKGIPLLPYSPAASKYERAQLVAPLWEAGLIYLPEEAPWLSDFLDEMQTFGSGAIFDDQVDMQSQILIKWSTEGTVDPDELIRRKFGFMQ